MGIEGDVDSCLDWFSRNTYDGGFTWLANSCGPNPWFLNPISLQNVNHSSGQDFVTKQLFSFNFLFSLISLDLQIIDLKDRNQRIGDY